MRERRDGREGRRREWRRKGEGRGAKGADRESGGGTSGEREGGESAREEGGEVR